MSTQEREPKSHDILKISASFACLAARQGAWEYSYFFECYYIFRTHLAGRSSPCSRLSGHHGKQVVFPPDKDFLRQTWFSYKYVSFPFLLFPFGRIKVAQRTAKYIVGRSICPTIWDILYLHRTNYSPFDQSPKLCSTIDLFPVFQMAIVIIVCFRWTPSKNQCSSKISNALPWQTLLPNCSCSWFHQKATEMTCQGVQPWKSMEQHGTLKNAWGDVSEVSDGSARCLHRGLERPSSSGDPNADITSEGLLLFDQIKDIKGETPACALLITLSSLLADSNPRFYTCQASHTRICLELLEDSAGCMILRCACMCMLRLRMIN